MKTINRPEILVSRCLQGSRCPPQRFAYLAESVPLVLFSGCPSSASVCMIRKGSNKVNVVGVTNTQKMGVNGE